MCLERGHTPHIPHSRAAAAVMQLAPRSAQPVSGRRGQAVHAQQKHGGSQLLQEPPRPVKSTGRRRGKALLRDVALKPMEKDDELLSQIASDLRSAVEATNMVQWYPGHIAKAEKNLKDQLKAVDIVLEVRDGRIPMSTRHPQIPEWIGNKPRVLLINRKDMVGELDRAAWSRFFSARGHTVQWTNGNMGDGVDRVLQQAAKVGLKINANRTARGLRPRPVRAVVIGFPNVGKSALINRLLGRRVADSAPKPGVTRSLRWARIGGDIDLLDAPGIIPMSFKDQIAAQRLAMCNDIGEASYIDSLVAAALLQTINSLPGRKQYVRKINERYKLKMEDYQEEEYVHALGDRLFNCEPERAGQRILKDFRNLALGNICLEVPQQYEHYTTV